MKFVTSLSDAGEPYSTESWQSSFGNSDTPLVVDGRRMFDKKAIQRYEGIGL